MSSVALAPAFKGRDEIEPIEFGDLHKGVIIPSEFWEPWLQRWDWTYHQLGRDEFPIFPNGYICKNLAEFQWLCISDDPVLWCKSFLRDLDDPHKPLDIWDYQRPSLRYKGDVIHEDASEVGKTYEIHELLLYYACTVWRGSALVAAPQTIYYIDIVDLMMDQMDMVKSLKKSLLIHRKHPHHHMRFGSGFKIDFRPTDDDGKPLRGVHVKTVVIMDEACKAKNPDIFIEFWRAGKPGCTFRLYYVPDGDRSCEAYRLSQKAEGKLDKDENTLTKNIGFRKFHWPKTLMPPEFWNEERKADLIIKYGGERSAGWMRNVLGEWGDPENSVWPWHLFKLLLKDIPDYKFLKITANEAKGIARITGYQYKYLSASDGKPEEIEIFDRERALSALDIKQEIKSFFSTVPGLKYAGADLGYSRDPSEILVKLIIGKIHRVIARVHLAGLTYDLQAEAIDAVDDVFDAGNLKMGWGIDFGNAGSAVVQILHSISRSTEDGNAGNLGMYEHKEYQERLVGYDFGSAYDEINEEGEVIIDKHTQKPRRLLATELSTALLERKAQKMELEYPWDKDIVLFYPNHTYRQGPKHRVFKDTDDHIIAADKALTLRVILPGEGSDQFASGSYER